MPTEITYIFAGTQKVCQVWDDVHQPEHERNYAEVVPAFCSDADKGKGVETGNAGRVVVALTGIMRPRSKSRRPKWA